MLGQPEFGIAPESVDRIADFLANSGIRTKDVVARIANTSYFKGQETATQKFESEMKTKMEMEQQKPKPEAKADPQVPNPAETEIAKSFTWLKGEVTKLREELKSRDQQEKQRAVTEAAKDVIGQLGFDDPQAVLLLARREADFAFDPNDGSTLIAVRAGDPTEPLKGPMTYTTAKDYFETFGQTQLGMKFKRVPEASKQGAGISGVSGTPVGKGPLHPDNLANAFSQLNKGGSPSWQPAQ